MSLFIRLPISVNDASLPVVPIADIDSLGVNYEIDSYDHWAFGSGDATPLIGLNHQRVLAPQSTVAAYGSNYLSLSSVAGNALLSDLDDVALGKFTFCTVVREPTPQATGIKAIFGNVAVSPALNNLTFMSGAGAARKVYDSYVGFTSSLDTTAVVAADTWYFVATALDFGAGTAHSMRTLVGGSPVLEASGVSTRAVSGRKWALGNGWYASASTGNQHHAEFILYDRMLSAADLAAVYVRSKARMAARGIVVL